MGVSTTQKRLSGVRQFEQASNIFQRVRERGGCVALGVALLDNMKDTHHFSCLPPITRKPFRNFRSRHFSENIFQRLVKIGKLKIESSFEEPRRRAAAAGERQGRFGSHQPRA